MSNSEVNFFGDPIIKTDNCALVTPVVTVALVSIIIAPANSRRIGLVIYNNGANTCYVSFAATSSSGSPTYIIPTFASVTITSNIVYCGQISCIRNAGTGTVAVWEYTL